MSSCTSCADCNPNTAFAGGTINLPQGAGTHKLFSNGGVEYGCIGVKWDGQNPNEDPPSFVARLKADGSYEVLDPTTRTFTGDQVVATVAPGIDKINVLFFIFKTANEQEALALDCASFTKGGIASCFSSGTCLFAWQVDGTNAGGKGGTCQLCRREVCNGKDDDCDGEPDNNGACGRIFNSLSCISHADADIKPDTPGCDPNGSCSCLVTSSQKVYVCAGAKEGEAKWTPIATVTGRCKTVADTEKMNNNYFCGSKKMLCDACPNKNIAFRLIDGGCTEGVLEFTKN